MLRMQQLLGRKLNGIARLKIVEPIHHIAAGSQV